MSAVLKNQLVYFKVSWFIFMQVQW